MQHRLTFQIPDSGYEFRISSQKVNWKNHESRFIINLISMDEIEKKTQLEK
jgi:hypothetical protein